jgi:parallel beta-helix repeat protein
MKGWYKFTFKMIIILISSILLFNLSDIFLSENFCSAKEGNTLYVGGSASGNYSLIQDAIDNASSGDEVFVYSGLYNEYVVINKSIDLIGEDKNNVKLDSNKQIYSILIKSPWINISGFHIHNSQIGILISDLEYGFINISRNIFTNDREGIRIYNTSNILIIKNIIHNNSEFGIVVYESENIEIKENYITQNLRGIYFGRWCNFNKILKNNCSENEIGIYLDFSFNNSIINNEIFDNNWGIYLKNSKSNNVTNNYIEYNDNAGITVDNFEENILEPNFFNKNPIDIRKTPRPPRIKAPGFEFFLLLCGILLLIALKKR